MSNISDSTVSYDDLDRLDRRILHELDLDSTVPLSQISKRLRIGSDLVEYRVKRFRDLGIIMRFTPVINPAKLGLQIFKTYIKHRMSKSVYRNWIKRASATPSTYWLTEGYGQWDVLLSLAAKTTAEYQEAIDELLADVGEDIIDVSVFPLVSVDRFPKHYLVGSGHEGVEWRSSGPAAEVDELERRLLQLLSENCRLPDTELAAALETSSAIVRYRKQKLEQSGVILAYRTQLDYAKLGMVVVKVFIQPKRFSQPVRDKLLAYCRKEPRITCFVQQLGSYPIELEAELQRYHDLPRLLEGFWGEFGEAVSRMEYMILTKDYYHRIPEG